MEYYGWLVKVDLDKSLFTIITVRTSDLVDLVMVDWLDLYSDLKSQYKFTSFSDELLNNLNKGDIAL